MLTRCSDVCMRHKGLIISVMIALFLLKIGHTDVQTEDAVSRWQIVKKLLYNFLFEMDHRNGIKYKFVCLLKYIFFS